MFSRIPMHLAVAAAVVMLAAAASAAPKTYKVDPVHSSVIFKVVHMNVGNFYGRFNDVDGEIVYDAETPDTAKANITIKADSVDTANKKRDDHLRSPDFFNTAEFPTITYKTTAVKKVSDKEFELTGDLAFHGQTKPVTAKLVMIGTVEDSRAGGTRAGAEATLTIKQSDFGMEPKGLSDEVDVIVALQGIAK